jgi:hypothetical protein
MASRQKKQATNMSALPPKADICSAVGDVRFVPEADMESWEDHRSTGIVLKRTLVLGLFWSV